MRRYTSYKALKTLWLGQVVEREQKPLSGLTGCIGEILEREREKKENKPKHYSENIKLFYTFFFTINYLEFFFFFEER